MRSPVAAASGAPHSHPLCGGGSPLFLDDVIDSLRVGAKVLVGPAAMTAVAATAPADAGDLESAFRASLRSFRESSGTAGASDGGTAESSVTQSLWATLNGARESVRNAPSGAHKA